MDIAAGTPASTYSLTYQICEPERPENCATATVTVQIDERPDVTLTLTVSPNIMTGTTQFNVLVKVSELNGVETDGQITIYIPMEKRWSLQTFDPVLTNYLGTEVKNGEWTMSAGYSGYLFTTTASVQGDEFSAFTFAATWTGDNTRGKATLTTQILSGCNEVKVNNNSDSEVLNYFA